MKASQLKQKYLNFFKDKGHAVIPSAPLLPENDPTVLFTTAGMHPLVQYLLGEKHPEGNRLANVQICMRTDDIDEVGDASHHTFFEMLGNWSLGDYWKDEAISWSYEFLTKELSLNKNKLWVTCFKGDKNATKDVESANVWKKLGIPGKHILFLGKEDNWWGPVSSTGPCGPDTEIFYDTNPSKTEGVPGDNSGRFFEIWNNVFMQYYKTKEGKYIPLKQKNVDTGMGVERTTAVIRGLKDDYQITELWGIILDAIQDKTSSEYKDHKKEHRIIADHIRAATFISAEGVVPSNKEQGYILRRLIRRAIRYGKLISPSVDDLFLSDLSKSVIQIYGTEYTHLQNKSAEIYETIRLESEKFSKTLSRGLREIEKLDSIDAQKAFNLYQTHGFPLELTQEIFEEKGQKIDKKQFEKEFKKHQDLSRTASAGRFKGGLVELKEETKRLHTATHLLHAALRKVLGEHVQQKGSNITPSRLRFDFTHPAKLTEEEIIKVEKLINEQIDSNLPVSFEITTLKKAKKDGALAFFGDKYKKKVKVYTIGSSKNKWFSKEVCGGPHVNSLNQLGGHVKITKEESSSAGIRRIYAEIV